MSITPYAQSLTHSCLAACLLMLREAASGRLCTEQEEQALALSGSLRTYPFYVVGIPAEFSKRYHIAVRILADNTYFAGRLRDAFAGHDGVHVEQAKVTLPLIRKELQTHPLICHIDNHALGDSSHSSHFVILERELPKDRILVVDPWSGKKRRMRMAMLENAIHDVKNHLKMCPLLLHLS